LKLGDRLPSELMHLVIASHLLEAMGVTGDGLDSVTFAPLPPVKMGQIRASFALATAEVGVEVALPSRRLYLALARHDELFFRLWRLPQQQPAEQLGHQLAEAWAAVAGHAAGFRWFTGAGQ